MARKFWTVPSSGKNITRLEELRQTIEANPGLEYHQIAAMLSKEWREVVTAAAVSSVARVLLGLTRRVKTTA